MTTSLCNLPLRSPHCMVQAHSWKLTVTFPGRKELLILLKADQQSFLSYTPEISDTWEITSLLRKPKHNFNFVCKLRQIRVRLPLPILMSYILRCCRRPVAEQWIYFKRNFWWIALAQSHFIPKLAINTLFILRTVLEVWLSEFKKYNFYKGHWKSSLQCTKVTMNTFATLVDVSVYKYLCRWTAAINDNSFPQCNKM